MPFIVYTLTNTDTNKFYIGSTSDLNKRVARHLNELSLGKHHNANMQEMWNNGFTKYTCLINVCDTREEAYALEDGLIKCYKDDPYMLNIGLSARGGDNLTNNPNKDTIVARITHSLNARLALMSPEERKEKFGLPGESNGMWGKTHTDAVKAFLSKNNIGRPSVMKGVKLSDTRCKALSEMAKKRVGDKNPFFGKKHTKEYKELSSLRAKQRNIKPSNSVRVIVDGTIFESYNAAARELNVCVETVRFRVKSNNPKFTGYRLDTLSPTTIETTSNEGKGVE
jgi:group I intron endonuclease